MKRNLIKFICFILCFTFSIKAANAEKAGYIPHKIIVQMEEDLSSNNPPQAFSVIVNDNYKINDDKTINKGTQIFLELVKVSNAKIAKIDASVEARVVKIYIPTSDKTIIVDNPNAIIRISKYEKLDIADKGIDAGITVANIFVKNLTYPAHFVKGVVQNKDGNRLKSGAKEVYDSSLLSYTKKGNALEVKAGDLVTFTYFTKL